MQTEVLRGTNREAEHRERELLNIMDSTTLATIDVVVGVDTPKEEHVAAALDGLGGRLGELTFAAGPEGYASLLRWVEPFGRVVAFGVEGTGCYGAGLARHLRGHAMTVIEVNRPPRGGERRHLGKSDSIDAEQAARAAVAGGATAAPKWGEGTVEAIRLIKLARERHIRLRDPRGNREHPVRPVARQSASGRQRRVPRWCSHARRGPTPLRLPR